MAGNDFTLNEAQRNIAALWKRYDEANDQIRGLNNKMAGIESKLDWVGRILVLILSSTATLAVSGFIALLIYILNAIRG